MSSRVLVTGGAGFLGSHLCEALIARGDRVVCADNLSTGRRVNVEHLLGARGFELLVTDVSQEIPVQGALDGVIHMASPASPPDYLRMPLETLAVGSSGTLNAAALAHRHGARFVLASTSEVYGDPIVHPQPESYWGNVNPIGPRSVYDESKRFAEALSMAWHRTHHLDVGIARIFNTYGPRMRKGDGRVVSNFVVQALSGEPLSVYGDGSQTRSLCYVDDMVRGLLMLLDASLLGPFNLGNPEEVTVIELARRVQAATGAVADIRFEPLPEDDPTRRCPDISSARSQLGFDPQVSIDEGLSRTIAYFASELGVEEAASNGGTGL